MTLVQRGMPKVNAYVPNAAGGLYHAVVVNELTVDVRI